MPTEHKRVPAEIKYYWLRFFKKNKTVIEWLPGDLAKRQQMKELQSQKIIDMLFFIKQRMP